MAVDSAYFHPPEAKTKLDSESQYDLPKPVGKMMTSDMEDFGRMVVYGSNKSLVNTLLFYEAKPYPQFVYSLVNE